jgi:hypothetical protein
VISAGSKTAAAAAAAAGFQSLSSTMRGCAIFDEEGMLAATGDGERWYEAGRALVEAADGATASEASHAHVATEEGEAFVLRLGGVVMVAVTDRFVLASLVFADMRAALRDAAGGAPALTARAA